MAQQADSAPLPPQTPRQDAEKGDAAFAKGASKRRNLLRYILFGSLAIHVLGMAVFGGVKLVEYLTKEEVVFEAPPPTRTYEPRKVELKVKVQKRQRSSSRPAVSSAPRERLNSKPSPLSRSSMAWAPG